MGKNANVFKMIERQNQILQAQSDLFREQNNFLQQLVAQDDERQVFIEDIDRDEIRDGFLVTSHRKKLWNAQIGLINEFARICKKYNLRWFAHGGTLLGAARHKGFIPWDDDIDILMLRPEYEKFRKIVASEIKPPYLLDIWYDYRREVDEPSELTDNSLPVVSRKHFQTYPYGFPFFPIIKIRDERTLFIDFPEEKCFNQSIWLDIFPFDSLPPFADEKQTRNFEIERIIYAATIHPEIIQDLMRRNQPLLVDYDTLKRFISLPYKQRGIQLEELLAENFSTPEYVGNMFDWALLKKCKSYRSENFVDVIYLPFEKIELPAPIGYENFLTECFGDWKQPVIYPSHASVYSADISYKEYAETTKYLRH